MASIGLALDMVRHLGAGKPPELASPKPIDPVHELSLAASATRTPLDNGRPQAGVAVAGEVADILRRDEDLITFGQAGCRVDFGDFILKSTIAVMGFAERDQFWLHVLDALAVVISVTRFWLSARSC